MQLTFIGADHEVTGSCTLLEACGKSILIDCGLEQGADIYENCEIPISAREIDYVLVTHAHVDHSGRLPYLTRNEFDGDIHLTDATMKLSSIMLLDSAHIQEQEAEYRNRKAKRSGEKLYEPLYTMEDAQKTIDMMIPHHYARPFELCDGITAEFFDAGHLLSSSSILLTVTEGDVTKRLLFSGDLGNPGRPLLAAPVPAPKADFVLIESTYGDRLHDKSTPYTDALTQIIQETLDRGGNVVIPAFAVGRTQEMLYFIRIIKERNLVKGHGDFPVYVDSPLAVEATNIYTSDVQAFFNDEAKDLIKRGINPISFDSLRLSVSTNESIALNTDETPKVIIAASGMCEAGRIRHHLKHNLWREESTIVFVGYQTPGTVGRKLLDGAHSVKLFGEDITVHAHIAQLEGISGHADRNMLLEWISSATPEKVFVNHGEDSVTEILADLIHERFGYDAVAPYSGDSYDLITGKCTVRAAVKRVKTKKELAKAKSSDLYAKLIETLNRLIKLVNSYKGRSNDDVKKFTARLNDVIAKFGK